MTALKSKAAKMAAVFIPMRPREISGRQPERPRGELGIPFLRFLEGRLRRCAPRTDSQGSARTFAAGADDLDIDPVGILDVQPRVVALQRRRAALPQIAFDCRPVEGRYPDRKMIHDPGRPAVIERH